MITYRQHQASLRARGVHPQIYKAWKNIKQRCSNPNQDGYRNYGGRGIDVCQEWQDSFEAFWRYVAPTFRPGLQIDRINNSRGYEPGNVQWVTQTANRQKQARTKLSHNKADEIRKSCLPTTILAARYGCHVRTIRRVQRGELWTTN